MSKARNKIVIALNYEVIENRLVELIKHVLDADIDGSYAIFNIGDYKDASHKEKIHGAIEKCKVLLYLFAAPETTIEDNEEELVIPMLQFASQNHKQIIFVNLDGCSLPSAFEEFGGYIFFKSIPNTSKYTQTLLIHRRVMDIVDQLNQKGCDVHKNESTYSRGELERAELERILWENKERNSEEKDRIDELEWYAEIGNVDSMYELATYYYNQGQPYSALEWYRKAAEMGDTEAMFMAGITEEEEYGYEEGFKWYKMAADNGHEDGMFVVARMYEFGQGVKKNEVEAIKWYKKAMEFGCEEAKEPYENLKKAGFAEPEESQPEPNPTGD